MNDTTSNNNGSTPRPSSGEAAPLKIPVETSFGSDKGGTLDTGLPGQQTMHEDRGGLTAEIDDNGATVRSDDSSETTQVDKEASADTPAFEPLPDYDPENVEVTQKYDTTFTNEDGGYNMENLSNDFWANGGEGLSEGTYKWLEQRGIDRATVKAVEEGQKALAGNVVEAGAKEVYAAAGGADNYNKAIEWARKGGYNEQQQKAYNDALDAGGIARADAIEALMSRATKSMPSAFRSQRRQQPQRSTNSAGGGSAAAEPTVKPYASYADYQADLRRAKKENNQELFNETRRRGKASKFY